MSQNYSSSFYAATISQGRQAGSVLIETLQAAKLEYGKIVDVGGGVGGWLQPFADCGSAGYLVDAIGPNIALVHDKVTYVEQDLRKGYDWRVIGPANVVVCVEVLEHLPSGAVSDILDSITEQTDLVVFSAAWPGQGGVHHVNERSLIDWEREWRMRGFVVVDALRQRLMVVDAPIYYQSNMFIATSNPIVAWKLISTMNDPAIVEGGLPDRRRRVARVRGIFLRRLPSSWVTKLAALRSAISAVRA